MSLRRCARISSDKCTACALISPLLETSLIIPILDSFLYFLQEKAIFCDDFLLLFPAGRAILEVVAQPVYGASPYSAAHDGQRSSICRSHRISSSVRCVSYPLPLPLFIPDYCGRGSFYTCAQSIFTAAAPFAPPSFWRGEAVCINSNSAPFSPPQRRTGVQRDKSLWRCPA